MQKHGDKKVIEAFKEQVDDKVRAWRCHEAAERLFAFWTNKQEDWLRNLRWRPQMRRRMAPAAEAENESIPAQEHQLIYNPREDGTTISSSQLGLLISDPRAWPAAIAIQDSQSPSAMLGPYDSHFQAGKQYAFLYPCPIDDPSEMELWANRI